MIDNRLAPYAALLLRLAIGVEFLTHAALKFFVYTPAGTTRFFESVGVPGALGPVTIVVETLVGVSMIFGIMPRLAALVGVPILVGAIATVHFGNGFFFSNPNGGWEFPAFWALALVAQAMLGDGALALVKTPSLGASLRVAAT